MVLRGSSALSRTKSYIYLGEGLLATESTSVALQFHHPDRLGTRLVTNASDGSSGGEQENLPFGTALGVGITGNQRRFTSYDRSTTTKLDYAVNRTYNAGLGRFTQVDPIGMSAASPGDPQSLNLYAYCQNDPINHVDPDGLDGGASLVIFVIIPAVLAALRAIFGGGRRARTAPIIKRITYRQHGQVSNRTLWTQAGIQAGVGAVSAFLQDQEVNRERSMVNADRDITSEVWTVKENGEVTYEATMNVVSCITWSCVFKEIGRGIRSGVVAAGRNLSTPIGFIGAAIKIPRLKGAAKGVMNLIPEGKLANHLFKGANKLVDNPTNRNLISEISNGKALGIDAYGKSWFARTMGDGTQIYTYTQNGVVKGAGINQTAIDIVKRYGLK